MRDKALGYWRPISIMKFSGRSRSCASTLRCCITALSALAVFCASVATISGAQTFTTLVTFDGVDNGEFPLSIVQGTDGRLWGTTSGRNVIDCGNAFKMTPSGVLSVVSNFDCSTGNEPDSLTLGRDGVWYGITFSGGTSGFGTVFKLGPFSGLVTVLYNFSGGTDGSGPVGRLVQGSDGALYGATYGGGSAGFGNIFKITTGGILTALYQFDLTHGGQPYAGLVQGTDGNFYGTTYSGGSSCCGTVFKITPQGGLTVLHSFGNGDDGDFPVASLIQGRDGNLYGTTPDGGPDNDGTVFKITPTGAFTILHSFVDTDGRYPACGVIQGSDGYFYGATSYGGKDDYYGTLFKMNAAGTVVTLHKFDGHDGTQPCALVQHTNGILFGVTEGGGDMSCSAPYGCGTVFSFDLGLNPFIEALPTSGKAGMKVVILGSNLSEATNVSFNGTAATFGAGSNSEITTTVPSGATTGLVTVTTPDGTLSSNIAFRVMQ